jgi:hypothetical protein
MTSKRITVAQWIVTTIFALFMLMDGFGGLMHAQAGVDAIKHLGYPEYVLTIVGIAKILGVIAVIQPKYRTIKEWAYAGFAFNFLAASLSWYFTDGFGGEAIFPIVVLAVMLLSYFLWKRQAALQAA